MNLKQITEQNPCVQLVVSASDLRELFNDWQRDSRAQLEAAKAAATRQQSSDDGLLTAKEAMAILRISPSTLWKLERKQDLVPVRIGRRVFYRKSDIDIVINIQKG